MEAVVVVVKKPTILAPDLRSCKKVGDLLTTIKDFRSDIFNDIETFLYILHGSDDVQMPLDGPYSNSERPRPPTVDSVLHISARPTKLDYDVHLRLPLQKSARSSPIRGRVRVWWDDTEGRPQEKIHVKYRIPMDSFMLGFGGVGVFDTISLYEQKILKDCVVTVGLSISIKYQFKKADVQPGFGPMIPWRHCWKMLPNAWTRA